MAFVFRATLARLDRDRCEAERAQVVRAGAHVDFADVARKLEAVGDQLRRREWGELERPLVEIHVRMQTAALLELRGVGARGLMFVERTRGRREETKRIEMRAAHRARFDDARDLCRRETQRP